MTTMTVQIPCPVCEKHGLQMNVAALGRKASLWEVWIAPAQEAEHEQCVTTLEDDRHEDLMDLANERAVEYVQLGGYARDQREEAAEYGF